MNQREVPRRAQVRLLKLIFRLKYFPRIVIYLIHISAFDICSFALFRVKREYFCANLSSDHGELCISCFSVIRHTRAVPVPACATID